MMGNLSLPLFEPPATRQWASRRTRKRVDYEADFALQCRACMLPEPLRQYPFAKSMQRRFTADFAWPNYRLLVEIQGGIWRPGGGAHSHPLDIERDIERLQYVAQLRWTMLPLLPKQVKCGYAIELTQRILERLGWRGGEAPSCERAD